LSGKFERTNPAPQIRNPKLEIAPVQFAISEFEFEVQDSSNCKVFCG
jgi:hypothetical protein